MKKKGISQLSQLDVICSQSAYKIINPGKKHILKYTTVTGIEGFDGSKKSAPKSVVQKIQK